MMNQKHRHRVAQALHKMEKIGDVASIEGPIEDSAEQLKKTHPQDKLFKVGIKSLKEYVQEGQESRESRAQRSIREREYIDARYKELISSFEHNYKSPKGRELLFAIRANDFSLRLFLKRNPEWRPRLKAKLVELERATKKVEGEQERKQLEKERTKELHKAIHKQLKKEGLV
ncbi:MAG TPA: hypothetical protein VGF61_14665 [Candidatus Acidoferrum sp.]